MNHDIITECVNENFADRMPFPETAQRLGSAGVRAYHADLLRLEKTYYGRDDETYGAPMPLPEAPTVADAFSEAGVIAALRTIQRGEIGYPEFLRRIMRAGTGSYSVFLGGRKAVYVGRDGQSYVENFPANP